MTHKKHPSDSKIFELSNQILKKPIEEYNSIKVIDTAAFKSEIVLIPWNESNTHWCLLLLDNKIQKHIFIDPFNTSSIVDNQDVKCYIKVLKAKKLIKTEYSGLKVNHSKQRGVWVCGFCILVVGISLFFS